MGAHMKTVEVKLKLLRNDAIVPSYQTSGAAGFDFCAAIDKTVVIHPGEWKEIPFGIAVEIPRGYELDIRSRSGGAFNSHIFAYHGLIDSDFRGELSVLLFNAGVENYVIDPGDRVAQGVVKEYQSAVFVVVNQLSPSLRGDGGFGSTGK